MKTMQLLGSALVLCALTGGTAKASDRVAVYARVDKVIFEPSAKSPERIQVWGVFSIAKPDDRNDYLPAARGYLYFTLPADDKDTARKEWADLHEVAGTGDIVAFGSRHQMKARLRKPKRDALETPANPDAYTINFGVTRVRGNRQYEPVRAIVEYRD